MPSVEQRLKLVMSRIFKVPIEEITEDASPDTIESWDSLEHMNLVLALEQEFQIRFSAEEIVEMLNFNLILSLLEEHGVQK